MEEPLWCKEVVLFPCYLERRDAQGKLRDLLKVHKKSMAEPRIEPRSPDSYASGVTL